MKRGAQSEQSVPYGHWATAPKASVSDPAPPSWQTPLDACAHASEHHIGGGGDGGNMKRAPQSEQSVPRRHCAATLYNAASEPSPLSWHAPLLLSDCLVMACTHESSHH